LRVDVPVGAENVVNSLTEGHKSDPPGRMLDTVTAGSPKLDVSGTIFLFCTRAVIVSIASWPAVATGDVPIYFDLLESGVSASPSAGPNIANGKNLIAGMVG
jgi:hypothetical protein